MPAPSKRELGTETARKIARGELILLREARVSLALPPNQQHNQAARDKKLSELNRDTDHTDELLNELRNCLAHASSPETRSAISREVQTMLQDENRFRDVLGRIADDLFTRYEDMQPRP